MNTFTEFILDVIPGVLVGLTVWLYSQGEFIAASMAAGGAATLLFQRLR